MLWLCFVEAGPVDQKFITPLCLTAHNHNVHINKQTFLGNIEGMIHNKGDVFSLVLKYNAITIRVSIQKRIFSYILLLWTRVDFQSNFLLQVFFLFFQKHKEYLHHELT